MTRLDATPSRDSRLSDRPGPVDPVPQPRLQDQRRTSQCWGPSKSELARQHIVEPIAGSLWLMVTDDALDKTSRVRVFELGPWWA